MPVHAVAAAVPDDRGRLADEHADGRGVFRLFPEHAIAILVHGVPARVRDFRREPHRYHPGRCLRGEADAIVLRVYLLDACGRNRPVWSGERESVQPKAARFVTGEVQRLGEGQRQVLQRPVGDVVELPASKSGQARAHSKDEGMDEVILTRIAVGPVTVAVQRVARDVGHGSVHGQRVLPVDLLLGEMQAVDVTPKVLDAVHRDAPSRAG